MPPSDAAEPSIGVLFRGQETPSEDPLVTAEYAVKYMKGFQGEECIAGGDSSLKLSACCFVEYAVNGVPACARGDLLEKARKEWGFQGYITSDCDVVAIIHEDQNYTASPEDSIADVLKAGIPCEPLSFFDDLKSYVPRTSFASGCTNVSYHTTDGFEEAVNTAKTIDIVIVVAGLNLTEETEDLDRVSLLLPGKQTDLIKTVANINKKPLVLVLMGNGPIDISFAKVDPSVASILWVGYPSEIGGQALAEALFGELNPGGRLPVTWYPESYTAIPMNDMKMRANPSRGYPGRTYRFYTGEVVYKFGYGLSYSKYSYKFLSLKFKMEAPYQIM